MVTFYDYIKRAQNQAIIMHCEVTHFKNCSDLQQRHIVSLISLISVYDKELRIFFKFVTF